MGKKNRNRPQPAQQKGARTATAAATTASAPKATQLEKLVAMTFIQTEDGITLPMYVPNDKKPPVEKIDFKALIQTAAKDFFETEVEESQIPAINRFLLTAYNHFGKTEKPSLEGFEVPAEIPEAFRNPVGIILAVNAIFTAIELEMNEPLKAEMNDAPITELFLKIVDLLPANKRPADEQVLAFIEAMDLGDDSEETVTEETEEVAAEPAAQPQVADIPMADPQPEAPITAPEAEVLPAVPAGAPSADVSVAMQRFLFIQGQQRLTLIKGIGALVEGNNEVDAALAAASAGRMKQNAAVRAMFETLAGMEESAQAFTLELGNYMGLPANVVEETV